MTIPGIPALTQRKSIRKTFQFSPLLWADTERVAAASNRTPNNLIEHLLASHHYGMAAMLGDLRGGEYPQSAAERGTVTPFRRKAGGA